MLPPVEADEELVAHGLYQQLRRGQPTRIQEFWTAHSLPDGALIWRSQLMYDGAMPLSACYLLRDPVSRPVQMVFYWRWQDGREDVIEYRLMPEYVTILHGGEMQDMIVPVGYEVYGWHTITEHFLWAGYNRVVRGEQTLTVVTPNIQAGTLWPYLMSIDVALAQAEILPGPQGPHSSLVYALRMAEMGPQHLHFDTHGIPVRWELPEEDLVVELAEYSRVGGKRV